MHSSDPTTRTKAMVPYNPGLPHISLKAYLESITDQVFRRSIGRLKTEVKNLSSLEQKWKERIVTQIAHGVEHLYIDKELGEKMSRLITQNFSQGKYDSFNNPLTFKDRIISDLKSICRDEHLDLIVSETSIPAYDPDWSLIEPEELTIEQRNYLKAFENDRPDFSKKITSYKIPETEIGYLKIDEFPSLEFPETQAIIDQTMKNLVGTEALIIDLRENYGGSPATVAFVASYLFDKRLLLNQIYQRAIDRTTPFYVEPEKLDQIFGGQKPIYILTSSETFSGGEELAYDLQASKRAKIIGQSTRGGAHPVRNFVVDPHFYLVVPYAKAVNPFTKGNWEKTGVIPDHVIPDTQDALECALALLKPHFNKM